MHGMAVGLCSCVEAWVGLPSATNSNLGGSAEDPHPLPPVRLARQLSWGTRPKTDFMAVVYLRDAMACAF